MWTIGDRYGGKCMRLYRGGPLVTVMVADGCGKTALFLGYFHYLQETLMVIKLQSDPNIPSLQNSETFTFPFNKYLVTFFQSDWRRVPSSALTTY